MSCVTKGNRCRWQQPEDGGVNEASTNNTACGTPLLGSGAVVEVSFASPNHNPRIHHVCLVLTSRHLLGGTTDRLAQGSSHAAGTKDREGERSAGVGGCAKRETSCVSRFE